MSRDWHTCLRWFDLQDRVISSCRATAKLKTGMTEYIGDFAFGTVMIVLMGPVAVVSRRGPRRDTGLQPESNTHAFVAHRATIGNVESEILDPVYEAKGLRDMTSAGWS